MGVVNVDDRSWDITYGNGWYLGGTSNEFDTTTHGANFAGATATFPFTGTSVTVYGTVPDTGSPGAGPVSTYVLDGGAPQEYTAVPRASVQFKVPFYTSPKLTQGYHTLVITTLRNVSAFWLDYISYTYEDPIPSTSSTTTQQQQSTPVIGPINNPTTKSQSSTKVTSTTANTQMTTFEVTSDGSTFTFTSSADGSSSTDTVAPLSSSPAQATKSSMPSGAIVGAVLGGIALLIAIILLVLVLRRRRRQDAVVSAWDPMSSDNLNGSQQRPGHVPTFVEQPVTYHTNPALSGGFHKEGYTRSTPVQPSSSSEGGIASSYASRSDSGAGSSAGGGAVQARHYYNYDQNEKGRAIAVVYEAHPIEYPPPPSYIPS